MPISEGEKLRLLRFRDVVEEPHLASLLDALANDDLEAAQEAAVSYWREAGV